ncbi:glycerophosphodiester phosphodiesterase [Salipaludibacillus sp. HK11]|uniref:glycerophosphodiester phosphodiesterase n=1 Tax=Salipaludibacillus sp. HK11 TaxID=3394320 RepID=UPI0039FD1CA5
MASNTLIFAHRGSAGTHPENTIVSFEEALNTGVEGIECDVQLTKDGIPVVIHDETVNRTTNGDGWVKDYSYEELKLLDAGSWFNSSFNETTIPSLEELFQWAFNNTLFLNIELKSGLIRYPGIEAIVLELITKYNLKDRIIISSFNHYSLVEFHRLDPTIETAILFMEGLFEPWNYAKSIGASALHCYLPVAVPELLQGASQAGMPVRPFTVNEDAHIHELIKMRFDAIITDWPEKAIRIRGTVKNE